MKQNPLTHPWPELPLPNEWSESFENLHLWSQIVGKIRLEYTPWINHSWHTTLYVSANGLTTSLIPHTQGSFEIAFDFINHQLRVNTVDGSHRQFRLEPMTVADFYHKLMQALDELGINVNIFKKPVELPNPITAFPENDHSEAYDGDAAHRFWRSLVDAHRVFTRFRAGFLGKSSPVHFFWGAFDLAVTRFSGRTAPPHPGGIPNCADWVMEEAYSHELASFGFWPGAGYGEAAFYAYSYPEPEGYRDAPGLPQGAFYHEPMGEFLLPYSEVQKDSDPDKKLYDFLQATYESAANNGNWDRASLEFPDR